MKMKIRFGEGGFKGFVLQHAEKLVFGVVLLLVAVFIYSSATQEGISMSETPEKLKNEATLARGHVTDDHWSDLAPTRVSKVEDFPGRAELIRTPIRDTEYAPEMPLDKPAMPSAQKRSDPEMLAPTNVEAKAGVYAVAWRLRQPEDAYADDKNAVRKAVEAPKPKKKKRDRRSTYGNEGLYGSGSSESSPYPEMYGAGSEGGYYGEEGTMPSPSSAGPGVPPAGLRKVSNFYLEQYVQGYRGGMGGGPPGMVAPKSVGVVAVTALVPFEKQWEEYERALADAVGYSAAQDIPKYLYFMAERAEVSSDPDAPLQWKAVSNTAYALKEAMWYAGIPKEVADEAYLMPNILTMPIPPILLKPYDELALHSEVPRAMARRVPVRQPGLVDDPTAPAADPAASADLAEGLPALPRMAPGMAPGTIPGSYGMESGGYGPGGYSTTDYGTEGMSYEASYATPYGPGGLRRMMVKYKMVRFFDLNAQPGKSYRYRVSVILEDPNRPRDPKADPNKRILQQAVAARLTKVEADDLEYQTRTGKPRRTYYIQTDWSEPSEIVNVEPNEGFVAGSATEPRFIKLSTRPGDQGPEVQITEAKGKLVVIQWDESRAVEVPAEREVRRGAYLAFKESADVLHPHTLQLKTLEDYAFDIDSLVADLSGGADLITDVDPDTDEKTVLTTPGEFLILNRNGEMVVCNEIDDNEEYRRLLFVDDAEQPMMSSPEYGSEYGSEGGYFPGVDSGYPSMYGSGT